MPIRPSGPVVRTLAFRVQSLLHKYGKTSVCGTGECNRIRADVYTPEQMRILGPVAKKIRDEGRVDLKLVREQRLQRYAARPKPEPKKTPAQILAASGKKKCCRCQQEKPFEEFSARSSSADGKNYQCKACERDRVKEYESREKLPRSTVDQSAKTSRKRAAGMYGSTRK
jgi:hypothetical protein